MKNRRRIRWSAAALVATAMSAVAAFASTLPEETPAESVPPAGGLEADHPNVPVGFDRRRQAIEASLKSKQAPLWAGDYYEGDGLGANIRLSLSADAGAAVTWRGCLGLYGANHGAVVESPDGVLRIDFAGPNAPKTFGNFPDELVPVGWGERQYLVPPGEMAAFVSAINHGREPRESSRGRFLLRDGDEEKPATGLPVLPPSVQAQVRHEAVEVQVQSVGLRSRKEEDGYCATRYVLHIVPVAGAVPPLFVGEQLKMLGDRYETAEVTALHGASADAELAGLDCDAAKGPKIGDRFTTGAYKEGQVGGEGE